MLTYSIIEFTYNDIRIVRFVCYQSKVLEIYLHILDQLYKSPYFEKKMLRANILHNFK